MRYLLPRSLFSILFLISFLTLIPFSFAANTPKNSPTSAAAAQTKDTAPDAITPPDTTTDAEAVSADQVAPAEESEPAPELSPYYANVTFRERTIFKLHYQNEKDRAQTLQRAEKATSVLDEAMNANEPLEPNAKNVQVTITPNKQIDVRIRGYKIIEINKGEIRSSGFATISDYQENLQTELNIFVGNEFQRLQVQKLALKFFLSVFFALLGFLVLRQARNVFNNADLNIEEKRESLKPMTFMSETLISSQALGGLFALFLVIGRVLTYSIVFLTTCAAILGQFTTTRNAMANLFSKLFSDSLSNIQSLIELLPGLLLAVVLLFLWNLSLKILDLFLRGVRSGRISWTFLQANRISVVRFWGTSILSLIFFPLVIAALFGRFNSPLEFVIIACAVVLCLSTLPILVSIAAGSFVLWFGQIHLGQWIRIGKVYGEVTDVTLFNVTLVPPQGGRIFVPMMQLLFKSYSEMVEKNKREFRFKVQRLNTLEDTTSILENLFPKTLDAQINCISLSGGEFHLALRITSFQRDAKKEILSALSKAHDAKVITLTSDLIEDVIS